MNTETETTGRDWIDVILVPLTGLMWLVSLTTRESENTR